MALGLVVLLGIALVILTWRPVWSKKLVAAHFTLSAEGDYYKVNHQALLRIANDPSVSPADRAEAEDELAASVVGGIELLKVIEAGESYILSPDPGVFQGDHRLLAYLLWATGGVSSKVESGFHRAMQRDLEELGVATPVTVKTAEAWFSARYGCASSTWTPKGPGMPVGFQDRVRACEDRIAPDLLPKRPRYW